ncbi:transmembrane amino acid transporter protein-domain-containing protein [Suillus plorans]|uniref:Transmembrane amino acid transporter protein-domain-containing protein n=1 Tax=Suillus plorans TaxID=116603 RepID=A0A9P7DCY8_9AGAM|nr:transmembrane amino acid transporter protein-domain-containing protein [Suillus plorans]KAG1788314.1 transmembrane amino acid transporter protein-domain-containing protein [Suillus plorans]
MFGPVAREVLAFGTVSFVVFGLGSGLLSSQQALSTLSNQRMCSMYLVIITGTVAFLISLPRTLDRLAWMGVLSAAVIAVAGFIAMIGAGVNPVPGRSLTVAASSNFFDAFLAVTNPVFAYAGHFMFFILISEMRKPEDAMKAAWCLQDFAPVFYVVFSGVMYVYIGNTVQSPVLFSLPPVWAKAAFAIALPNFLLSVMPCSAKLVFVRYFVIQSTSIRIPYSGGRFGLCCVLQAQRSAMAAILAIAVPIFSYLIGITAALFAAWYTYGLAGCFWLHDAYHLEGGLDGLKRRPIGTTLAVLTIISGTFICVAGTYVSIKLIAEAYANGQVGRPFVC